MNKVTREHYPASRLPSDLREGIDPGSTVTVTVVTEESAKRRPLTLEQVRQRIPGEGITTEEAVARVRALRDEWDD